MSRRSHHRGGFTLVEAIAVTLTAAGMFAVLSVARGGARPDAPAGEKAKAGPTRTKVLDGLSEARRKSMMGRDVMNVRNIQTALVTWAYSHKGKYTLPSEIDVGNSTIAGPKGANADEHAFKNNTGNIFSILVWNGNVAVEWLVSPFEPSSVVKASGMYEYRTPSKAASPREAMWDPGFGGTPLDAASDPGVPKSGRHDVGVSNNSYAHSIFDGARARQKWSDTLNSTAANVSSRGPRFAGTNTADEAAHPAGGWKLIADPASEGEKSFTLGMFDAAKADAWEGHVAYADNHVSLQRSSPAETTYSRLVGGKLEQVADNLFVDETDEVDTFLKPGQHTALSANKRTNNYLRPIAAFSLVTKDKETNAQRTVWRD